MIDSILLKFVWEGLTIGIAILLFYFVIPDNFFKAKLSTVVIGCALTTFFIFYAGRSIEIDKFEKIVLKQEIELAELRERSKEVTVKIITKYVDKIKVIQKERVVYATKTNEILNTEIVNNYPVPNGFVRLHNSAAEGTIPEGPRSSDEEASPFKINQVADTVIDNYLSCRENTEQLISLQQWVKEQEVLFNSK